MSLGRVLLAQSVLLLVLLNGCSSDEERKAAPSDPFGGSAGSAGTGNNGGSGGGAGAGQAGAAGQVGDGGPDSSSEGGLDSSVDTGKEAYVEPDVVITIDACPIATAAFGSSQLRAVGEPKAFVDAYNAELDAMSRPGPWLMQFNGLNKADPKDGAWKLKLGGLQLVSGGPKVGFVGTPSEIAFDLRPSLNVYAQSGNAPFLLHFDANDISVAALSFGGQFDSTCEKLNFEFVDLLIPATAGDATLDGTKLSTLLGQPNAECCGGKANAWKVSLMGTATPVNLD